MRRVRLAMVAALLLTLNLSAEATLAAEPTFGQQSASASLGRPVTLSSNITGTDITAVEVLLRLAGEPASVVMPAQQLQDGAWSATAEIDIATSALCACHAPGQSAPNTRFEYQFRVRSADGSVTLGPIGEGAVSDDRFEWRTMSEDQVRVHWYAGDEPFARGALDVANQAIDRASELLGATLAEPVDLFVYDTEDALRSAVSPNRENIAGQAHAAIQTMFVHIPGGGSIDPVTDALVAHELTHLVFDAATRNPYRGVPRWLDEGVAVYLSEGYNSYWRPFIDRAVADRSLIPLDGLGGLFPSSVDEFYLAYAESVAAVDYFVRTHTEQTLWDLVRSYARGLSDDDAFTAATGQDLAAFNAAWFSSLGLEVPDPVGPQAGPPGPQPADWQNGAPPTIGPVTTPGSGGPVATPGGPDQPGGPVATPGPQSTPVPSQPTHGSDQELTRALTVVGWVVVAVVIVLLFGVLISQRDRDRRPPSG